MVLAIFLFFLLTTLLLGNYFAAIYSALAGLYPCPCLYYLSRDCETEDKGTEEELL